MTNLRHGLSVGVERTGETFFISMKVKGKLTHSDYEKIIPIFGCSIEEIKDDKVKVFVDMTELEGWELRAAWDDFKLGLTYGNKFEKIALLGRKEWLKWASKVGGWFTSGEVKYFEDEAEALTWLCE